jgi:ABC transport system ATP-binding/permease protein
MVDRGTQMINNQPQFQISYVLDNGAFKNIYLPFGTYFIGRSEDCGIYIPVAEISRKHAQLELTPQGCFIMDLGSANGTQIDRIPLFPRKKAPVQPGQTISLYNVLVNIHPYNVSSDGQSGKQQAVQPQIQTALHTGWMIKIKKGQIPWKEIPIHTGEYIIGREQTCQIALDSQLVSRKHASIVLDGNSISIVDHGSRNGVLLQGQKIPSNQRILVKSGDVFQVDEYIFEIYQPPINSGQKIEGTEGVVRTQIWSNADLGPEIVPSVQSSLNLAGKDRITIGRESDNLMVLNHPNVSRYHAVIERMGTRSRIIDLHSANGLYINGSPVKETAWLKSGDSIKIGPYQILFTGNELRHNKTADSYTIDVIGINKWVTKKVNLLKDINLNVGENEFVALVGMSGDGKSTLMDAINGFRPATHGKVYVNGVDLYQNYGMFRDDIGNVPQKDIVHMELTPEQALNYAALLRMPADTSPQERNAAIHETLEDLGLTFKKDIPISRLSGGQLKRVSIGVELLTKPRLFFLDEPTSGLDPGTEYEMMKLLRRLADQGRTIMIITHATKNVMFCDKAIILARGGNLAYYGPPEEALEYFDTFRTPRERLEKDMEFDDIYRILTDEKRGMPEDWRDRYLKSKYARYCSPTTNLQHSEIKNVVGAGRQQRGRRISALKQFFILSARNLKCMFQDKTSLGLTLALAPILGMMNFIWGNHLFDPITGSASKVMSMWFITAVIAILVGAMGAVREIVKENDIYKRERAVGLRIFPYALSKVWIGIALAIYQGFFILLFVIVLVNPKVQGLEGYLAILITMILAVIGGYLLGLAISAMVPNQNSAQIVLIAFLVPQFLFAGMLQPLDRIPLGEIISPFISTRWVFEAFVRATGMGNMVVADQCWNLPKEDRIKLTASQKESCLCMGVNIFRNCADFPGLQSPDFYDQKARLALVQSEPNKPVQPTQYPSPTPLNTPTQWATPLPPATPSPYPTPTRLPYPAPNLITIQTESSQSGKNIAEEAQREAYYQANQYKLNTEKQFEDYRLTREAQFTDYSNVVSGQLDDYQGVVKKQVNTHVDLEVNNMKTYGNKVENQFQDYSNQMQSYGDTMSDWEKNRQQAVGSAETILGIVYDDYGRTFQGYVEVRWIYLGLICIGEFILILIFQKRKDVV